MLYTLSCAHIKHSETLKRLSYLIQHTYACILNHSLKIFFSIRPHLNLRNSKSRSRLLYVVNRKTLLIMIGVEKWTNNAQHMDVIFAVYEQVSYKLYMTSGQLHSDRK